MESTRVRMGLNRRRGRSVAAVLGVVAIVASACGGDDEGGSDAGGSSGGSADTSVLGERNEASGTPVKIGLINVEGGSIVDAPEIADAAVAAAEYANDYLGGLDGHPIEIVRCGDKGDGASAVACANQFIEEGVAALVAGQPAVIDPAMPLIQGAGIPYIATGSSGVSESSNPDAYFFTAGFLGTLGAQAVYAAEQGYETVVVLGSAGVQLESTVNELAKPLFAAQGIDLELVTLPLGTPDATPQVTATLEFDPDAVAIYADAGGCQSIYTALQTVGSTLPKLTGTSCITQPVLDAVGDAGFDGTRLFSYSVTTGDDEEAQLFQAIMEEYAPDAPLDGLTPNGYESMLGMIRAVNSVGLPEGDVTTQGIAQAMSQAKDVALPIGNGETFDCSETQIVSEAYAATICNSLNFVTTYDGLEQGEWEPVDSAPAFTS